MSSSTGSTSTPVNDELFAAALKDPAVHRQLEQSFIAHVEQLLDDDRLRIDTIRGRRPVAGMMRFVNHTNKAVDVKRVMSEMRLPDRELQNRMPVGESLDVTIQQRKLLLFKGAVGRLRAVCVSPTRALLAGQAAQPLKSADVLKVIGEIPPPLNGVPSTIVVMSTSGFTLEAHEVAERRSDRTVILVEPNKAGGWAVYGPVETKSLVDLFDPEADESKRSRVSEEIDLMTTELTGAGIATDKIAAKTQLPLQLVESEMKNYAKSHPGLVAKRLDGRVVLFREGNIPSSATSASGGGEMPLIDRMKALFARKGETEKKISFLSERRTALMQQRDRSYDDMSALEAQEGKLRTEFKEATGEITKRRVTGQLLQLRKDIERRQQLLGVLNQQVNIVSTHLHNLELVNQGKTAKLPDSDEVAHDAAKAEEMLAGLEADAELAGSVGTVTNTGMSEEELALYKELEGDNAAQTTTEPESPTAEIKTEPTPTKTTATTTTRRAEPEAG
jgi:hypothetical protein